MAQEKSRRARSDRRGSRDEPSRQLDSLGAALGNVELQLRVVGEQDEPGDPPELVREREALRRRRRRIALMLQIDQAIAAMASGVPPKGKRTRQGPKGGVRSVAQGGSPGQGKSA